MMVKMDSVQKLYHNLVSCLIAESGDSKMCTQAYLPALVFKLNIFVNDCNH